MARMELYCRIAKFQSGFESSMNPTSSKEVTSKASHNSNYTRYRWGCTLIVVNGLIVDFSRSQRVEFLVIGVRRLLNRALKEKSDGREEGKNCQLGD